MEHDLAQLSISALLCRKAGMFFVGMSLVFRAHTSVLFTKLPQADMVLGSSLNGSDAVQRTRCVACSAQNISNLRLLLILVSCMR